MESEIVIQDCGCVAIPDEIADAFGMLPGARLKVVVDAEARSITLTAPTHGGGVVETPMRAACPIK
jgi:hypothetical protein